MIGLMAVLLAGVVLRKWIFGLAVIPYVLRLRSKNLSLIAFYGYVLVIVLKLPGESVYVHEGLVVAIVASTSTFLLLDEVLRGIKIDRTELALSALLLASAVYDSFLVVALITVTIYVVYLRFGRVVYYLLGWLGTSAVVLYLLKDSLPDRVAQSFLIIGLGLVFLLFAERSDVEFLEVDLLSEE